MSMLENYFAEVATYLPRTGRNDILDELRGSVHEQFEDLADKLGRAPNECEQAEQFRRLGHPMQVAAAYLPTQHLIGPSLYPLFMQVLKLALVIVSLVHVAIAFGTSWISGAGALSIWDVVKQIIDSVYSVSAIIVLVFAALEYSGQGLDWFENWDPRSLLGGSREPIDRSNVVTNLVSELVFLLWLNGLLDMPNSIGYGDADVITTLSHTWQAVIWPVNWVFGADILLQLWLLVRRQWHFKSAIIELVINALVVVITLRMLVGGKLLTFQYEGTANIDVLSRHIELGATSVLWFVLLWSVYEIIKSGHIGWRLRKEP